MVVGNVESRRRLLLKSNILYFWKEWNETKVGVLWKRSQKSLISILQWSNNQQAKKTYVGMINKNFYNCLFFLSFSGQPKDFNILTFLFVMNEIVEHCTVV